MIRLIVRTGKKKKKALKSYVDLHSAKGLVHQKGKRYGGSILFVSQLILSPFFKICITFIDNSRQFSDGP